ncbi:MAG: DUF402 domain-containing protein [Anaerolineae bacterium]|jgi:protein associated with RNAse G/E|nr:DUF402 domain-containing protein [Chloroflexota bacterium]
MAERSITISKLSHNGVPLTSYPGQVLLDDGETVAVRCRWTLPKVVDVGAFVIAPGDTLIEYFYQQQPFNILAVYAGHTLKGWYCNILAYTCITPEHIGWADLALDLVVSPPGDRTVLDRDEFEALDPSAEQRRMADEALNTLNEWVDSRQGPFGPGALAP